MLPKILYVVNNDSTTSIPLEVAGRMNKMRTNVQTVIYYKNYSHHPSEFVNDSIKIGAKNPFDANSWFKMVKIIRSNEPDIIHAHHTISAFICFLFARIFLSSAKLIKTEHNNHAHFKWYQNLLNFFILLFADQVLCNSKSTLNSFSFIERRIAWHKSEVCYNGVNLSRIKSENAEEAKKFVESEYKIVGSVGRLIHQKDYGTLISAFKILKDMSEEKLKLVIIGEGKELDSLRKLVKTKNIEDSVVFTGLVDRTVVFSFLNLVDVFVMTSLWEGFCNTLVEAMAAEKAVVCSEISTLKEVGGKAVLFAKPGNPDSFAKMIKELLENEKLKNRMKRKAGKRAQKFSLEACAKRYINHY